MERFWVWFVERIEAFAGFDGLGGEAARLAARFHYLVGFIVGGEGHVGGEFGSGLGWEAGHASGAVEVVSGASSVSHTIRLLYVLINHPCCDRSLCFVEHSSLLAVYRSELYFLRLARYRPQLPVKTIGAQDNISRLIIHSF